MKIKLTFWKVVFVIIMILGAWGTVVRFTQGLGAATNLSDQFPWGIWIGFDVLCGVMLAAGGFTLTAAVYILNIKRWHAIVRPTVLTAFLGYVLVCVALMFEVAYCVMLYTTVLALEFSQIVLEKFKLEKPLKFIRGALIPLVIVGVILSTLHQSSLGTLYLIMPTKLHPFWYSPLLPVFFFLSAIAVGLAMTIFESSISSKVFHRQLELPILQELGRVLYIVLWVYFVLRLEDLINRGEMHSIFVPGYEMYFFWLEILLALIAPMILLSIRSVRNSPGGLYLSAVLVVLGFITNRLNVSITGIESWSGLHYVPKWTEYSITAAIVAVGFALFGLAVKYLPIFPEEKEHGAVAAHESAVEPESVFVANAGN